MSSSEVAKAEESKPLQAGFTPVLASHVLISGWWNPKSKDPEEGATGAQGMGVPPGG